MAWAFVRRGRKVVIEITPRATASSFLVVCDLAVQGLGITRLPGLLGDEVVRAGQRAPVLDEHQPPAQALHAVYASGKNLAPKVRAFVELLAWRLHVPQG